ncbi:S1 RNA-binding domain-containing protein, partial [Salipiger bermudensis]|uniref:S1 RNA-binding domain-containing protein n=1 Tax=Salipiger bermudensis TaxID=344736 RepID=UPI0035166D7C
VKDPHEVVTAGDVVRVRVTEVDVPRKRIGLSMRKDGGGKPERGGKPGGQGAPKGRRGGGASSAPRGKSSGGGQGALGAALADAMKKR